MDDEIVETDNPAQNGQQSTISTTLDIFSAAQSRQNVCSTVQSVCIFEYL